LEVLAASNLKKDSMYLQSEGSTYFKNICTSPTTIQCNNLRINTDEGNDINGSDADDNGGEHDGSQQRGPIAYCQL
jgi:hypothetical protein